MVERDVHLNRGNHRSHAQGLTTLARLAALAMALLPCVAGAQKLDYSLYTGVEHSSNIALSPTDPMSQNVLIPGLNFIYAEQGSTVQANVAGTLEYHDFLGDKFENQTQTELSGHVNWAVLPSRLDFSFDDSAGVQPLNSLASNAPGNQQQINVLSLGPTLQLEFPDALRGQFELRYINSYASKTTNFDSSSGLAAFRLYHEISPTDQISLNVESQRVLANNVSNTGTSAVGGTTTASENYTRNELYGRYLSRLAKVSIDAEAGWTGLHFNGAPDQSGPMGRVTLAWLPTPRSSLELEAAYQYSNAAQDMLLPLGAAPGQSPGQPSGQPSGQAPASQPSSNTGGISVGNTVVNSQIYLEHVLQATYRFRVDRWSASVTPMVDKLKYINDPTFNQSGHGGTFTVDYRLRSTITLSTFATAQRLTYDSLSRTDTTYQYGVNLIRQWTPHWSTRASFARQLRTSNALGQSYHENQIYFGVVFKR